METAVLYQSLQLLAPVKAHTNEEHDTHIVYDLPGPVLWDWKECLYPSGIQTVTKLIRRVCVSTSDQFAGPCAIIVPVDEQGAECPLSAVHVDRFGASPWTAYKYLGFTLAVDQN